MSQVSQLTDKNRRSAGWIIARGITILLISGFAGAMLVRLAPGFDTDERLLDPRFSAHSREAIGREHSTERNLLAFYVRFLNGIVHGDAGRSIVFAQPVGRLIAERAPQTLRAVLAGLAFGWSVAILLAVAATVSRRAVTVLPIMVLSGSLLSIPSAVLAAVSLLLRLSPAVTIAAVLFPRIFPVAYELLRASLTAPHVIMARARGLPPARLFLFHVIPSATMPLVALGGVSVTLACSASIPIEALADSPGVGQLAWQAALGRDVSVLVVVTLLLTAITVAVNVLVDLLITRLGPHSA